MRQNTLDRRAVPYTRGGFRKLGVDPPPSPATLHRWRLKGRFGIRLETFLRGGRRFTTADAVQLWFERVTAAADGRDVPVRTARQQHQSVADAMSKLEQEGM